MTDHYFENDWLKLHYYQFGSGAKKMLCFHGYGMHGKQFKILEATLGDAYTLYGFDLFFHKQTVLKAHSLAEVKKGISKKELAALICNFCTETGIARFSVIGYSMGTHYATAVTEELPEMIDEYIVAAPSCLKPGAIITFFSKNKIGNRLLEKLTLNEKALINLLYYFKRLRIVDKEAFEILYREIETDELRFNFYACFTYLRYLETDFQRLQKALNQQNIKSIFIFGKKDKAFPAVIGKNFIAGLKNAQTVLLNEGHEMIKSEFAARLTQLLK